MQVGDITRQFKESELAPAVDRLMADAYAGYQRSVIEDAVTAWFFELMDDVVAHAEDYIAGPRDNRLGKFEDALEFALYLHKRNG